MDDAGNTVCACCNFVARGFLSGIFSMKLRMSIAQAIVAFGLITAAGLAAMLLTSTYALNQLKVGGSLYTQIKLGNDLVADILPPPLYVV